MRWVAVVVEAVVDVGFAIVCWCGLCGGGQQLWVWDVEWLYFGSPLNLKFWLSIVTLWKEFLKVIFHFGNGGCQQRTRKLRVRHGHSEDNKIKFTSSVFAFQYWTHKYQKHMGLATFLVKTSARLHGIWSNTFMCQSWAPVLHLHTVCVFGNTGAGKGGRLLALWYPGKLVAVRTGYQYWVLRASQQSDFWCISNFFMFFNSNTHTHTYAHMHARTHMHSRTHPHTHTDIHTHTHTHTQTHSHTNIHTHEHTQYEVRIAKTGSCSQGAFLTCSSSSWHCQVTEPNTWQ